MQKTFEGLHRHSYWFLLLIPLVIAGFYKTYFSVFFDPVSSIIHIHFTLMALFVTMLITQPFLIRYGKFAWHRLIGRISYVLVPLLLISTFLMIRFSYFRFINDQNGKIQQGLLQLNSQQVLKEAATYEAIAFYYLAWLTVFYCLAIFNRRNTHVHSRYIVATALTMLGPTVDRIIFFSFGVEKFAGFIRIESIAFFMADIILIILLIKDYQNKRSTKAIWTSLLIFITGQVLYFTLRKTDAWENFVTFIMRPSL